MAIRITKVYTRVGDDGKTQLIGGGRVYKDSQRIESYGCLDELNAAVGLARTVITVTEKEGFGEAAAAEIDGLLRAVQNHLFDAGSLLATPPGVEWPGMPRLGDEVVRGLEEAMDRFQKDLPALPSFCLPGGTLANAALHQCRTLCRRAEREIVRLLREESVDPAVVRFVNRLSDFFFVLSRHASKVQGIPEYLWENGLRLGRSGGEPA